MDAKAFSMGEESKLTTVTIKYECRLTRGLHTESGDTPTLKGQMKSQHRRLRTSDE